MSYIRAHINLEKTSDINDFILLLSEDKDKYMLENEDGSYHVNAKSLLGVIYASAEFGEGIYLVNKTHDGHYPFGMDKFRVL